MTGEERLCRVSDLVGELELFCERALCVQGEMALEYFDLTDPSFINYYHDKGRIQCDIVLDYIGFMRDKLEQAKGLVEKTDFGGAQKAVLQKGECTHGKDKSIL